MTSATELGAVRDKTRYLFDTHLLLWVASDSARLPEEVRSLVDDEGNELWFSAANIWEVAIKNSLARPDFAVDPWLLYGTLIAHGYQELAITGRHTLEVAGMPLLHRDPFDRILVAQARVAPMILLTNDRQLAEYDGPIEVH